MQNPQSIPCKTANGFDHWVFFYNSSKWINIYVHEPSRYDDQQTGGVSQIIQKWISVCLRPSTRHQMQNSLAPCSWNPAKLCELQRLLQFLWKIHSSTSNRFGSWKRNVRKPGTYMISHGFGMFWTHLFMRIDVGTHRGPSRDPPGPPGPRCAKRPLFAYVAPEILARPTFLTLVRIFDVPRWSTWGFLFICILLAIAIVIHVPIRSHYGWL